jgi:hypothetical protein
MTIRKLKSGCYKATIPLYNRSFYISLSNAAAGELMSGVYVVETGMVQEFESDPPLMVLIEKTHEVIAHECTHMAMCIMFTIGMKPDIDNQEPMAYLMGFIAERVYEAIGREDALNAS